MAAPGRLVPEARRMLDQKRTIVAGDVLGTGELGAARSPKVNKVYAGFTFGYNRPLLANRVHDVLTCVDFVRGPAPYAHGWIVGMEAAGLWVVLRGHWPVRASSVLPRTCMASCFHASPRRPTRPCSP